MKPLELTVYPLLEKVGRLAERGYIVNRKPITLWYVDNYEVFEKRLTDAELAAEKWHAATHATYARARVDACLDNPLPITADKAEDIVGILHRFATLPHYDEVSL